MSPEPQRKGLPLAVRLVPAAVLAGLAMVPVTVITGALLTPALWTLEPLLGIELGGHSGPAEWVLLILWLLLTSAVTGLIAWRRLRTP